jgi:hypothetical protein
VQFPARYIHVFRPLGAVEVLQLAGDTERPRTPLRASCGHECQVDAGGRKLPVEIPADRKEELQGLLGIGTMPEVVMADGFRRPRFAH